MPNVTNLFFSEYSKPFSISVKNFLTFLIWWSEDRTNKVSLEMMINHGKAVVNNSKNAIVIIDMPYGSYEKSKHLALKNANLILKKTGAFGVKLEGGTEISETIKYLVKKKN